MRTQAVQHLIVSPAFDTSGSEGDLRRPVDHDSTCADGWSRRDVAILEMLTRSTPRTEIARRLGCSTSTVDRRLGVMREQLGVKTTVQVIVAAVRKGLI